jgi:hypothetical protein
MTRPLLVPDSDVVKCQGYFGGDWIDNTAGYRMHFSFCLGRQLTTEETQEILSRINGYGPHPYRETWESVERSSEAFWRSSR